MLLKFFIILIVILFCFVIFFMYFLFFLLGLEYVFYLCGSWFGDKINFLFCVWYCGNFKILSCLEVLGFNFVKFLFNLLEVFFVREEMVVFNINGVCGRDLFDLIKIKGI